MLNSVKTSLTGQISASEAKLLNKKQLKESDLTNETGEKTEAITEQWQNRQLKKPNAKL